LGAAAREENADLATQAHHQNRLGMTLLLVLLSWQSKQYCSSSGGFSEGGAAAGCRAKNWPGTPTSTGCTEGCATRSEPTRGQESISRWSIWGLGSPGKHRTARGDALRQHHALPEPLFKTHHPSGKPSRLRQGKGVSPPSWLLEAHCIWQQPTRFRCDGCARRHARRGRKNPWLNCITYF
jgi:hypothetical protein